MPGNFKIIYLFSCWIKNIYSIKDYIVKKDYSKEICGALRSLLLRIPENIQKIIKQLIMKKLIKYIVVLIFIASISAKAQSIVEKNGQLSVEGNKIVNKDGQPVQFVGMSMFWSQWSKFYNKEVVNTLVQKWNCSIIRAAMGVEAGGYLTNPVKETTKIKKVIDACIAQGVYVIIDWHDHNAEKHTDQSISFFEKMATEYGSYPNIIYEIYNEPTKVSWAYDIKPYAEKVIGAIRKIDKKNIIVVGTPVWSQDVDMAADNPIKDFENIAYTLHFYAATHKAELIKKAQYALDKNIALMVTEWGTCEATGNGNIDTVSVKVWSEFMDKNKLSWCNWSLFDKKESASVLIHGASHKGIWSDADLTTSGRLVKAMIMERNKKSE
jgi:endoglucanase